MNAINVAWHCPKCGRIQAPKGNNRCQRCASKMVRCSRYEWFLADKLREYLSKCGKKFIVIEQYPIDDHRGYKWRWDVFVWVEGSSWYGGYGEVIDIQGPDHKRQKKYSGPGGGYTRDYDKYWVTFELHKLHKRGIGSRYIENEDCNRKNVDETAKRIVDELIKRSDEWL